MQFFHTLKSEKQEFKYENIASLQIRVLYLYPPTSHKGKEDILYILLEDSNKEFRRTKSKPPASHQEARRHK